MLGDGSAEGSSAAGAGAADSLNVVAAVLAKLARLQGAVAATEATRRNLHDKLAHERGNVRTDWRVTGCARARK